MIRWLAAPLSPHTRHPCGGMTAWQAKGQRAKGEGTQAKDPDQRRRTERKGEGQRGRAKDREEGRRRERKKEGQRARANDREQGQRAERKECQAAWGQSISGWSGEIPDCSSATGLTCDPSGMIVIM
ncbi:unnamed protein product [Closterium sp. NIES-65]|nr:unnamed protein product [Closterium sp. NIES-65]